MVRKIALIVLAVGLVAFGIYNFKEQQKRANPTVILLEAAQDIPAGTVISPQLVRQREAPFGSQMVGALSDPRSVVGKKTIVPIYAGEQFLPGKLASVGEDTSPYPGRVLMGIPVNLATTAGMLIRKGDKITLYSSPKSTEPNNRPMADVIGTDIPVAELIDAAGNPAGAGKPATVAVLALTPQQAREVAIYQEAGVILGVALGVVREAAAPAFNDSISQ